MPYKNPLNETHLDEAIREYAPISREDRSASRKYVLSNFPYVSAIVGAALVGSLAYSIPLTISAGNKADATRELVPIVEKLEQVISSKNSEQIRIFNAQELLNEHPEYLVGTATNILQEPLFAKERSRSLAETSAFYEQVSDRLSELAKEYRGHSNKVEKIQSVQLTIDQHSQISGDISNPVYDASYVSDIAKQVGESGIPEFYELGKSLSQSESMSSEQVAKLLGGADTTVTSFRDSNETALASSSSLATFSLVGSCVGGVMGLLALMYAGCALHETHRLQYRWSPESQCEERIKNTFVDLSDKLRDAPNNLFKYLDHLADTTIRDETLSPEQRAEGAKHSLTILEYCAERINKDDGKTFSKLLAKFPEQYSQLSAVEAWWDELRSERKGLSDTSEIDAVIESHEKDLVRLREHTNAKLELLGHQPIE